METSVLYPVRAVPSRILKAAVWLSLTAQIAFPVTVAPTRSFSLHANVIIRETVAAAEVDGGKLYFLITDRGPEGRSAILLEADGHGRNVLWQDLKTSANLLTRVGSGIAAIAPIPNGLRVLRPTGGDPAATDLTGHTALAIGSESQLVRLLGSGDIAVQTAIGVQLGAPRILATSADLKVDNACSTCGAGKVIVQGVYVLSRIDAKRVMFVHRSSAAVKVVDLETGKLISSGVLANEDIDRGRAMFANRPRPPASMAGRTGNPTLIIAGAAHPSGDTFLLVGPFTPAEGARVIRVSPNGHVLESLRCMYPAFKPADGPPDFLEIDNDELYLITRAGHVNVYSVSGAPQ